MALALASIQVEGSAMDGTPGLHYSFDCGIISIIGSIAFAVDSQGIRIGIGIASECA
jgi:hypothetical protein